MISPSAKAFLHFTNPRSLTLESYIPSMQTLRHTICRECFRRVIANGLAKPRVGFCVTRPFTTSRQKTARDDERIKVRWFEQSGDDSTRRPVGDFEAAEDNQTKELKAELDKEDAELQEMRKQLLPEEYQVLEDAIAEAKLGESFDELFNSKDEEEEDDFEVEEDGDLDLGMTARSSDKERQIDPALQRRSSIESQHSVFNIQLFLSADQKPYLEQLNRALRLASTEKESMMAQETLWRWYTKCKHTLPPFLSLIPDPSWDLLDRCAKYEGLIDQEQTTRSRILLEDMKNAGRPYDRSTKLSYIRLLLKEDRPADAARQWKQDEVVLRADRALALAFEELGVEIFAKANDFQKAHELALGRIQSQVKPKSRALIALIEAWARDGNEQGLKTAWALYEQFKNYMGSDIILVDFDRIARIFIYAGRADISLAVFKDYMITTQPWKPAAPNYLDWTFKTFMIMDNKNVDIDLVSRISLTRIALLPREYQNKYFYAAWMKRLIATGDNKGALAVVQLMYHRNIQPDAKHLNGIIAGWLRMGNLKEKEYAIQLAWRMVVQRLAFVAQRNGQIAPSQQGTDQTALTGLVPPLINSKIIAAQLSHPLPCATIETFSMLLVYYERRSMVGYVEKLLESLVQAEIHPNAYILSHLMYAQLRLGDYNGVWTRYREMSKSVPRSLETFACLWDTQKGHLSKVAHRNRQPDSFVSPRRLFCEMIEFMGSQTSREYKNAREMMSQELYDQIVRCFCLANDMEGTYVCLHALKKSFGFYPDQNIARMLSIQVSRLQEGTPAHPGRRRKRVPKTILNLAQTARILNLLADERGEDLLARGIKVEEMDETFKNEESLYILTSMLRVVLERQLPEGSDLQKILESVAWEMGVSSIYIGDHLDKPTAADPYDIEHVLEAGTARDIEKVVKIHRIDEVNRADGIRVVKEAATPNEVANTEVREKLHSR